MNTVLQVLNYSRKLVELYGEYKFSSSGLKSIITTVHKGISKDVEYFYDEVIEEGESKLWHVVTKKKDPKMVETNEKLIKTITNTKFNQLLRTFFDSMAK